jgi:endonuclease/exonuclease/phosphatase family metal-dependent hydrolase
MIAATFNIYWLGGTKIDRTEADVDRIALVIAKLNADVLAFQEIMRAPALQAVIDRVNAQTSRRYRIRNMSGKLLASGSSGMRVMMVYDAGKVDLLADAALEGGSSRRPCALHVRERASGKELTVVGVHFQSGYPDFDAKEDADVRRQQCEHLASWLSGGQRTGNEALPAPPTEDIVILGDFNAINDLDLSEAALRIERPEVSYDSLAALRSGAMVGWHWPKPLEDAGSGCYSVYAERLLIDFILLSPSLASKVAAGPKLYAFDRDPAVGASGVRLSDHRPVFVALDL